MTTNQETAGQLRARGDQQRELEQRAWNTYMEMGDVTALDRVLDHCREAIEWYKRSDQREKHEQ